MKVLVVEDDLVTRKVMEKYLSPYGETVMAADGDEAYNAFLAAIESGSPFSLICVDIKMPKTDGHELLKKIRKAEDTKKVTEAQKVKIIMTTVLQDPQNVFKAFYKGKAASYLIKPFTEEELVAEIRKLGLL
jgi:two-component system chemotaxis response regulator CheY